MSQFFCYISTKSTADPYLPARTVSLDVLARDVADAFEAISGGRFEVGKLAFYPVQRSVPNHLLCDGSEVSKASFPELYRYLGDVEGTPVDADNFVLPNYLTGFAPATIADPETVTDGTVSTPTPVTPPPDYYPEVSDPYYGDVESGGRPLKFYGP